MLKRTFIEIAGMGAAGIAIPAMLATAMFATGALAGGVPSETLNEHRAACVKECTKHSSAESCKQLCGCTTDEIAKNWTATEYNDVYRRLEADAADKEVRRKLEKLHRMCSTDG